MQMCRSVAGCVVVVWLLPLFAARSEGHITFFSPKEMMLMKEREGRKEIEPKLQDIESEEESIQQLPPAEDSGNPHKTMEVAPALEEIIHEMAAEHQKAK